MSQTPGDFAAISQDQRDERDYRYLENRKIWTVSIRGKRADELFAAAAYHQAQLIDIRKHTHDPTIALQTANMILMGRNRFSYMPHFSPPLEDETQMQKERREARALEVLDRVVLDRDHRKNLIMFDAAPLFRRSPRERAAELVGKNWMGELPEPFTERHPDDWAWRQMMGLSLPASLSKDILMHRGPQILEIVQPTPPHREQDRAFLIHTMRCPERAKHYLDSPSTVLTRNDMLKELGLIEGYGILQEVTKEDDYYLWHFEAHLLEMPRPCFGGPNPEDEDEIQEMCIPNEVYHQFIAPKLADAEPALVQ